MMYQFFKRLFDVVISFLLTLALLPILLLVALLIKLESTGPVFYVSNRVGRNEKLFPLFKFRTMTHKKRKQDVQVFDDNPEITRVGKFLRRTKIDELPQLLNVMRGELSLVGPRPCLPSLLVKMDDNAKVRFKVLPGMTGLSQVNGNIYLDWEDRWKLDSQYVEQQSLIMDAKIIFKTILVVLFGEKSLKNEG